MTCYSPVTAYRSRIPSATGGFGIVFNKKDSNGQIIKIPCQGCIGCRLEKSLEWATRCTHEAQMHKNNSFITLTYNQENLPYDGSLTKPHFQKFIKRLRKNTKTKIRYYMCGEYGDNLARPHYHAILFGYDFNDKKPWDNNLSTSQELETTWQKGFCTTGQMTFESAAYCARYALKKIYGDKAYEHYQTVDLITGQIYQLQTEYAEQSRNPGIGKSWYDQYKNDLFPRDECIINGRIMKPPKYYTTIYQKEEPQQYEQIQQARKRFFGQHKQDTTWQRLIDREQVKNAQIQNLNRKLETT